MPFEITRRIEIDAGHRIPDHGSKCRNVHGHRYVIEATCKGALAPAGEQRGMVLDFGFLKDEMVKAIDAPCDHGMILAADDPLLPAFMPGEFKSEVATAMAEHGFLQCFGPMGKLYVIPDVPTAECLARHWFGRLKQQVWERSEKQATLMRITVWETPNCSAVYPA